MLRDSLGLGQRGGGEEWYICVLAQYGGQDTWCECVQQKQGSLILE